MLLGLLPQALFFGENDHPWNGRVQARTPPPPPPPVRGRVDLEKDGFFLRACGYSRTVLEHLGGRESSQLGDKEAPGEFPQDEHSNKFGVA